MIGASLDEELMLGTVATAGLVGGPGGAPSRPPARRHSAARRRGAILVLSLSVMGLPARRPDADTSCKRAMTRAPLAIVISAPLAIESRKRIKISEREETLENFQ